MFFSKSAVIYFFLSLFSFVFLLISPSSHWWQSRWFCAQRWLWDGASRSMAVHWEPLQHSTRPGWRVRCPQSSFSIGSCIALAFSRHHLEVRDRQTEFSGPWQLLHPLPDSSQLQLTLNFSIATRWVWDSLTSLTSWILLLQHRLCCKMENPGHSRRRDQIHPAQRGYSCCRWHCSVIININMKYLISTWNIQYKKILNISIKYLISTQNIFSRRLDFPVAWAQFALHCGWCERDQVLSRGDAGLWLSHRQCVAGGGEWRDGGLGGGGGAKDFYSEEAGPQDGGGDAWRDVVRPVGARGDSVGARLPLWHGRPEFKDCGLLGRWQSVSSSQRCLLQLRGGELQLDCGHIQDEVEGRGAKRHTWNMTKTVRLSIFTPKIFAKNIHKPRKMVNFCVIVFYSPFFIRKGHLYFALVSETLEAWILAFG